MSASVADVHAAMAGDATAYGRLVARHQGAVCGIALAIVRDVAASEDIAQEVFVTGWTKLSTLQQPESFGPWVRQMTRNVARTWRRGRSRYRARVVTDDDAVARATTDSEDERLDAEERRVLRDAIDALPDGARDVMILYYREGRSVRQVAALLDLSEAAVKKRLSRAREAVGDEVRARLAVVLVATAPSAALTTAVLGALAPAPALAAGVASASGVSTGTAAGLAGVGLLAVVLGYRLAERVTRPERVATLRRARNLTVFGIAQLMALVIVGSPAGVLAGMVLLIAILTWVQLRMLPWAFALPDAQQSDPARLLAERIGRLAGVVGLIVGAACGLWGALHGWAG